MCAVPFTINELLFVQPQYAIFPVDVSATPVILSNPDEPNEFPHRKDPVWPFTFNEKPSLEDARNATGGKNGLDGANGSARGSHRLPSSATLHTNIGDISFKLFPKECPKTVENFTTHCRNGYYDAVIFHRIIKGFMIQTGDPLGDGTGGTSIWGSEFEDEINRDLRHDRAGVLSSANAGPNTNGSQFFITTVPTPWLDGKHSVFGRVSKGMDIVNKIENLKVDKADRPLEDVKIVSASVSFD